MLKVTSAEIEKLAHISNISIAAPEVEKLATQVSQILQYASFLKDVAAQSQNYPLPQNSNVMRQDVPRNCDAQKILALAPEREEDYFVVPVIISGK